MFLFLKVTLQKRNKNLKFAAIQANEEGCFWDEDAKLWADGNMKFVRNEALSYVSAEDCVRYKYVEQSLGINHDKEF